LLESDWAEIRFTTVLILANQIDSLLYYRW